tara:strand:+ start:7761 stop:8843 length:1083 start_codon:yes stop_codon:yes gene_type:complete
MELNPEMFAKSLGMDLQEEERLQENITDLTGEGQPEPVEDGNTVEVEDLTLETSDSSLEGQEEGYQEDKGDVELTDESIFSALSERLGREVNSFEDLEVSSVENESDFASDRLKVINDYVKATGRTVEDYLATQSLDVSEMSDVEAIAKQIRLENPSLSKADVDAYVSHTYKLSEKDFTESERGFGKVQLARDAKGAKDYFNKIKDDFAQPMESSSMDKGISEEARTEWVSNMEGAVSDLEGIEFAINDNESFSYSFDEDTRSSLVDSNSNLDTFFDKYISEDGDWDYDSLNKDMFILNNFDNIVRSVANQYKGKGTEDIIQEIKNPSVSIDKRDASAPSKNPLEQMAAHILGNRNSLWG